MGKAMRKNFGMGRKSLCLAGAALALAGSVTVGSAAAYFTTYATASGSAQVNLGFTVTEPREEVSDWTKRIVIDNTGDQDCYVRVKALVGNKYQEYVTVEGPGWTKGENDDFYYYSEAVPSKGSTPGNPENSDDPDVLRVRIDKEKISGILGETEDFNVVIIQESTPVLYDEEGKPYADWNVVLDSVRDKYE